MKPMPIWPSPHEGEDGIPRRDVISSDPFCFSLEITHA